MEDKEFYEEKIIDIDAEVLSYYALSESHKDVVDSMIVTTVCLLISGLTSVLPDGAKLFSLYEDNPFNKQYRSFLTEELGAALSDEDSIYLCVYPKLGLDDSNFFSIVVYKNDYTKDENLVIEDNIVFRDIGETFQTLFERELNELKKLLISKIGTARANTFMLTVSKDYKQALRSASTTSSFYFVAITEPIN